jgi:hypothetical protein
MGGQASRPARGENDDGVVASSSRSSQARRGSKDSRKSGSTGSSSGLTVGNANAANEALQKIEQVGLLLSNRRAREREAITTLQTRLEALEKAAAAALAQPQPQSQQQQQQQQQHVQSPLQQLQQQAHTHLQHLHGAILAKEKEVVLCSDSGPLGLSLQRIANNVTHNDIVFVKCLFLFECLCFGLLTYLVMFCVVLCFVMFVCLLFI